MTVTTATTKDIVIKQITTTLTDEQIKSLPNIAVEVVPAPGAGRILLFQYAIIHKPQFIAPYDGIEDQDGIRFYYLFNGIGDGGFFRDDSVGVNELNLLLYENIEDDVVFLDRPTNEAFSSYTRPKILSINSASVNEPILIRAVTNSGNDWTGGNIGNSIKVSVFYLDIEL